MKKGKTSEEEMTMEPCPKCKTNNSKAAKFCNNCGSRLGVKLENSKLHYEVLSLLHLVAASYCLIYALSNTLIHSNFLLLTLYVVPGALGLYLSYTFNVGKIQKWTKLASGCVAIIGLIGTSILFLIGLNISGIVGPAWIIFAIILRELWKGAKNPL